MRRQGTLINALKTSFNDVRTSTLFTQTLYDSESFNAQRDTSEILADFFNKNAYQNCEPGISNTQFHKEKMNKANEIGRHSAKVFGGTKLLLK